MKNFQINKIRLENIKTYVCEEVNFSDGYNVIIGENGAGKSTILESIHLAIFGETVTGRRLVDMVRYGENQGRIIISFSVDGTDYRIEHEVTKKDENRATQSQLLYDESVGALIAEGRRAVKTKVEELFGIDSTTFINAVYASQGEIGEIVTAKDKDRKKLFDRLFQIDKYEKAWSNLSKVNKIIETNLNLLNQRAGDLQQDIVRLPDITEKIKEMKLQLKQEKSKLTKTKKEFTEVDKQFKTIQKVEENYNLLLGEKKSLNALIKELDLEIATKFKDLENHFLEEKLECTKEAISKKEKALKKKTTSIKSNLESLRQKEKELTGLIEKIRGKKTTLETLNTTIADKQQEISSEKKSILSLMPSIKGALTSWLKQIDKILKEKTLALEEKKEVLEKFEKISSEITKKEAKLDSLEDSINKYHTRIVKKRLILSKEVGDNWKDQIKKFQKIDFTKGLEELAEEITGLESEQTNLIKNKSIHETELQRIKSDLRHLENIQGGETCPTCKQKLSEEMLDRLCKSLKAEKSTVQKSKKDICSELKKLKHKLAETKKTEKSLAERQKVYQRVKPTYSDLLELEKDKQGLENEQLKLKEEIKTIKEEIPLESSNSLLEEKESLDRLIYRIMDVQESLPELVKDQAELASSFGKAKTLKEEIDTLEATLDNNSIQSFEKEIKKVEKELEKLNKILQITGDIKSDLEALERNTIRIESIVDKIREIELIPGFNEREEITNNWNTLNKEIATYDASIKRLKNDVIPPLSEQFDQLKAKKKKYQEIENNLALEKDKILVVSILRNLMRELPNRLLPNFIERINESSSEILQSLIPGSDIQGVIVNDDYSLQINRLGNKEDITVLSGGETIIVALALRLAFAKEFSSLDALILDEPTIFLDERRRGELVSVLERNRLVGQLLVVTHDPDFERISDKTYYITKTRGETRAKSIGEETEEVPNNLANVDLT